MRVTRRAAASDLKSLFDKISSYYSKNTYEEEFRTEVYFDNTVLYEFQYPLVKILHSGDLESDVIEALDRSGIFKLRMEFNPSAWAEYYLTATDPAFSWTSSGAELIEWLYVICQAIPGGVKLIPDTNFLRRHYYTNVIKKLITQDKLRRLNFSLSRLCLIEIENKYNRASKNRGNDYREGKEKRVGYHTAREIVSLKKSGADILPALDMTLLQSFTPESGKGFADPWIRRELSNYQRFLDKTVNESDVTEQVIFLTCDMMNALLATSEDISTFYVSRIEESWVSASDDWNGKMATAIMNTAIQFGECECRIKREGEESRLLIKGTWSGKSIEDWLADRIMIEYTTLDPLWRVKQLQL